MVLGDKYSVALELTKCPPIKKQLHSFEGKSVSNDIEYYLSDWAWSSSSNAIIN